MKKKLSKLIATFRQPKWRHGRFSALLMGGFLTACILVNVGVQALENEYGWRQDFSFNAYATTSEETKTILDRLQSDVELYLLYQSGSEDVQALQVLNRYEVLSERITVIPTDIAKNPAILSRFAGDVETTAQADTVIVNCPDTGRYKLLTYSDFLTQGYNIEEGVFEIEGLAYEKKLTEAIVYVTQDEIPTLGILQGHAELTADMLVNLTDFLKSNNYESVTRNLLAGETLEGIDALLIAGPQKDFTDLEIQQISEYTQAGGNLFVMMDYLDPVDSMPNYLSLLKSYGIIPMSGIAVASEEDVGSYYEELIYIMPTMNSIDMTVPLISGGYDALLLTGACAFETPGTTDQSLTIDTVLQSGPNAYVRKLDANATLQKQAGDQEGILSLALYAQRMHSSGNISRVFAIGNSALFTDEYLYQHTFNEEFIIQIMGQLIPQNTVSLDIMASSAFRPSLTPGSQVLGIALLVAIPMLIIVLALCMLLPRRNR